MKEVEIEKLRQIISRTDRDGNEKVEMLVQFVEQQLKNLNIPAVVNCKITDKIYQMPIHTCTEVNTGASTFDIVRVAGGWIYTIYRLDSNQMTSTFVPFNNEFMCDK